MFMAIDQYGETVHSLKHPRKELCEQHNVQHAEKVYVDKKDGRMHVHVGYVVAGHWYRLYEVKPFERGGDKE